MMKNFNKALRGVLKHEGGYVNHPHDPGGATNKGVTLGTFRRYVKRSGTVDDLKHITDEQVARVYKKHYWDKVRGDDLPGGVDYAVFDFAVNSGPSRAAKYLQHVVGARFDGKVGPETIGKAKAMAPDEVINRLCDDRLAFLKRIKGGRTWRTFGRGWARRVAEVREASLGMADYGAQWPFPAPPDAETPVMVPIQPPEPKHGWLASIIAALLKLIGYRR